MKCRRILAAAAVVVFASGAARAQDAAPAPAPKKEEAPARHENKVSDAAKALFEKYEKTLYTPVRGGLKDLRGTMTFEATAGGETGTGEGAGGGAPGAPGGAGGGGGAGGAGGPAGPGGRGGREGRGGGMAVRMMDELAFTVDFKAPDDLKVGLKDSPPPEGGEPGDGRMAERIKQMKESLGRNLGARMSNLLRVMVTGFTPAKDAEFDADVKVENGVSTLVLTSYLKGVEVSHSEFTLNADGLPATGVINNKSEAAGAGAPGGPGGRGMRGGPGADGRSTIKFAYAKEGDVFRLDRMTFEGREGSVESTLNYVDAGGVKVVRSWELPGPMGAKMTVKFSDLVVNGKPVSLTATPAPAPEKKDAGGAGEGGGMGGEGGK
jgi:hypothetical protein